MAVFDWRDSSHWASKPAPCGVCDKPTNLRSDRGKPAHKVCAETWTDQNTKPASDQS
ncbi:hypothetical protein ACGFX4_40950 [Kitasatospora sp. NPDC048365]|uniref:hypothetical protein n=1 Tax=Kitasatospora sp. NPDC048365 TaxID=3364050 RepID=UPI00371C6A1A